METMLTHRGDVAARITSIDWNSLELGDPTDLFTIPMVDTERENFIDIPIDDSDKEDRSESSSPADANRDSSEDVDGQLMEDGVDGVDYAHDDELVNVYDRENTVIEVGKWWTNMDEFRMCLKTYAVKHEFDAKTKWTDRKMFCAMCRDYDENAKPCKWYV
ncbi:hypothetical protein D1007_23344 [Hordeum vulgare]|nr:hypothetical protein D1007_23344 [Hordeum vulgare]